MEYDPSIVLQLVGDEQPVDASQPATVVDETPQCTVDRDALAGNLCVGNAMVVVGLLRDEEPKTSSYVRRPPFVERRVTRIR